MMTPSPSQIQRGFTFRPGTLDALIYRQVVTQNEYYLPEMLAADGAVVDIGGHIGSFTYACWLRGARNIHIFEAEPENYAMCQKNVGEKEGVTVYHTAVWRSDGWEGQLFHTGYDDIPRHGLNTGGGNVLWDSTAHIPVPWVPFDDLVDRIGPIQLLKIDAETSEFPILLTSARLSMVKTIVGEFHEVGGAYDTNTMPATAQIAGVEAFTIDYLKHHLENQGFEVKYQRTGTSNMGHFNATRH